VTKPILLQDDIPVGNVYDKYATRNPLARYLVANFLSTVVDLVRGTGARLVHEVGCGEGELAHIIAQTGIPVVTGSDFSAAMIELAASKFTEIRFQQRSIYELRADQDAAELVVCCEVLEHLLEPRRALERLASISRPYCILSVPREPLWRALNCLRGSYLAKFGNTPGHAQHWSRRDFVRLAGEYFEIAEVRSPIPWTVLLCRRA
jgi:2-polyprenyl-3-methyl-5-hydroxy-6-metoxy-1,4-benzoquinol methylase